MAMTVAIALGSGSTSANAERPCNFTVTVSNSGSSALTLLSLAINAPPNSGVAVAQPRFLTMNVPVGAGNPVISASGSASYGFQAVFHSPQFAQPSPQNPGGASPINAAQFPFSSVTLTAIGQTSDGSVFSGSLVVPILSAETPFPVAEGGAAQFSQGSNLINLLTAL